MREMIRNAWLGWQNYTDNGKLAALLLMALLFFWLGKREKRNKFFTFIVYTTIMTVCCICPFTAAVFMQYQTRFYDYPWIWSLVPVTMIIALAGTLLWIELTEEYARKKGKLWKCAGITAMMVSVICLCGRMGNTIWESGQEIQKEIETSRVLEIITENGENTNIVLWAPQGIMEYARALNGCIRLPYGRNMWDDALNAYSYDTYGDTEKTLYVWMSNAEETGEGVAFIEIGKEAALEPERTQKVTITAAECVDMAAELGVTHILLPENMRQETLEELENRLGTPLEQVEGYYLFRIREH